MSNTTRIIIQVLAVLSLVAPSLQQANTMRSCVGWHDKDRNAYQLEIFYENIQPVSMPTICHSFIDEFKKSCGNFGVNCNSDSYADPNGIGSKIVFGVLVPKPDFFSSYTCAQVAFKNALQAAINLDNRCDELPEESGSASKQKRSQGSIAASLPGQIQVGDQLNDTEHSDSRIFTKRQRDYPTNPAHLPVPDALIPVAGDQLVLNSQLSLDLIDITGTLEAAAGPGAIDNYFVLATQLANQLGTQGDTLVVGSQPVGGPPQLQAFADANVHDGAGPVDPNDWQHVAVGMINFGVARGFNRVTTRWRRAFGGVVVVMTITLFLN